MPSVSHALGLEGARRLPLALMVVYFIACMVTLASYVGFVRFNRNVYGDVIVTCYLVFAILGTATYFLCSGVAWLWAAKYTTNHEDRVRRIAIGVFAMCLMHDIPIFTLAWVCVQCCGFTRNPFFAFAFVYQCMVTLIAFVCSWLLYAYSAAAWLQEVYMWPTEDATTIKQQVKAQRHQASAIKAHFTRSWHPAGTEDMSPAESRRKRRSNSVSPPPPIQGNTPGAMVPAANAPSTVKRTTVGTDGYPLDETNGGGAASEPRASAQHADAETRAEL